MTWNGEDTWGHSIANVPTHFEQDVSGRHKAGALAKGEHTRRERAKNLQLSSFSRVASLSVSRAKYTFSTTQATPSLGLLCSPLMCPLLSILKDPLTGNRTRNPSVHGMTSSAN